MQTLVDYANLTLGAIISAVLCYSFGVAVWLVVSGTRSFHRNEGGFSDIALGLFALVILTCIVIKAIGKSMGYV